MSYDIVEIPADIPAIIPILPLLATVVFPATVVPLAITQPESLHLINTVLEQDGIIGMVALRGERAENLTEACYTVGTVVRIHRLLRLPDGTLRIAVEGLARFSIQQFTQREPWLYAEIRLLPDTDATLDSETFLQPLVEQACLFLDRISGSPGDLQAQMQRETDPQRLSFLVAQAMMARRPLQERQDVLELLDTSARMKQLLAITQQELELVQRVSPPTTPRPDLDVLSSEISVAATSDSLPFDIALARRMFAENIVGYREICEVLLGYLATRELRQQRLVITPAMHPLCLIGALQTGKSALAQAMARAVDYKYSCIDGRLLQASQVTHLLTEIYSQGLQLIEIEHADQLSHEVACALAEWVDRQSNPVADDDHSAALILILAARNASLMTEIVRERAELIVLPELTDPERLLIAREVIFPMLLDRHGLQHTELQLSDERFEKLIHANQEPGMAEIARQLVRICRTAALHILARTQGLEADTDPIIMG